MQQVPLARQCFQREVQQAEDGIDLEKAALFIAQEEYPDLDIEDYLNALETMAAEVRDRLPTAAYPLRIVQTINQYLYEELGFRGNTEDYYDPRNSFLNEVIDRRTGIPITLALVYLAIARRIDFPMLGIGMPGHFLMRPDFEDAGIFVDAFNQGEVLFPEDCEALLSQLYGQPMKLRADFLQPVTNRQFLGRMLNNLKAIYLHRGDLQRAMAAIERIQILFPQPSA